jgi:DNA polymerase gamma 1
MCIAGLTGLQRIMMKAASVGKAEQEDWMDISCLNNLQDVYQLYCGGQELDKEMRNVFVHGTLDDIKEQFQVVLSVGLYIWPKILVENG